MIKPRISIDRLTSFTAIFVSLSTLIVFIYQTNLIRKQQYTSVMPHLYVGLSGTYTPNFKIFMENTGIGPAIIESMTVRYKGKEYQMDLPTFLYEHAEGMDSLDNVYHSNVPVGTFIPVGRTINMIQVDNSQKDADALMKILTKLESSKFDFEIIYRSVYGERWRIDNNTVYPEKLE